MKKFFISISIILLLMLMLTATVFAAETGKILEVPDLKIIMDGKLTQYENVPIIIAQSTLLPLRELLVNLGVPNDDEHIIYNKKEKSVTILTDQTRIYLSIGNRTAYVNDQPVELVAVPVIYNNLTYIPFRFVGEALARKVVWDDSANAIYICDAAKYDSIKRILDNSDEAMKQIGKYKQTIAVDTTVVTGKVNMKIGINAETQIDVAQKKMYMKMVLDMLGMEIKMDSYYTDNASYIQDPFAQTWQKKTYLQPEYDILFTNQSESVMLEVNDTLCAGLTQAEGTNPNEILLRGDVYLNQLFKKALINQQAINSLTSENSIDFDAFNIEMSLDSNTYLVNSILMKVSSVQTTVKESTTADVSVNIQYSDYNGGFQITVPEDVIKNAVEIETESVTK